MEQREMVDLIRGGVAQPGGTWADLGAGHGNFSWALAELLGNSATIYALDRDASAVRAMGQRLQSQPPPARIVPQQADLNQPLPAGLRLPALDGCLLANLLHFMRDQPALLRRAAGWLKPGGCLLLVEYEQAMPLPWVPFPVPFARLSALCQAAHVPAPRQLATRRSPTSGQTMYAAVVIS